MSLILLTTLFYKALILQGEIWCWSLLGLKRLRRGLRWQFTSVYEQRRFASCPPTSRTPLSHSRPFLARFNKIQENIELRTVWYMFKARFSFLTNIWFIYMSELAWLNSHHDKEVWTLNSHFYHLFLLFQHTFIQSAKSLTILNNMIQEALNIMEEESTREDNEV